MFVKRTLSDTPSSLPSHAPWAETKPSARRGRLLRQAAVVAFAVGTGTASVPAHAQTPAQKMLDAHNNERKNYHNVSLQWSPALAAYAQQWAEGLVQKKQLEHRSNTKDNPFAPGQSVGENAAYNYGGANAGPDAVQQWISEKQYYNYAQDDGSGGQNQTPGCATPRLRLWALHPSRLAEDDTPGVWHKQRPG